MITDYIGGEGSAETPKNDYVIYGWPLILVESMIWRVRNLKFGPNYDLEVNNLEAKSNH